MIKFIKQNKDRMVIILIAIPVVLIWVLAIQKFVLTPKAANIKSLKNDKNYQFGGKSANYSVKIGDRKNNEPKVEFSLGPDKSVTFYPASARSGLSKPTIKDNTVTFTQVYQNTNYIYKTVPLGVKEDIVIEKPNGISSYPFFLELKGITPQYYTTNIAGGVFYDEKGKYIFNFEKPYAVDAKGNRNDEVNITIKKDTVSGKLVAILNIDKNWLSSPKTVYPVTIDPTVVYDTTSEFANGSFNRGVDTGSGSSPNLITNYQELPADINTVGLWHMNEASGNALDSSGNGNTGTPTGTTIVTGQLGNARSFDGSSYITTSLNNLPTTNLTIEFWANENSANTGRTFGYENSGSGVNGLAMYFPATTTPSLIMRNNSTVYDLGWGTITTGSWNHYAVTISSTGGTNVYLNGALVNSNTSATAYSSASVSLRIGAPGSGTQYFNGLIDEFKISNVTRTPEEIKLDAQRRPYSTYTSDVIDLTKAQSWNSLAWTTTGLTTGDGETLKDATSLVAQWNFNATSGTTANNDAEGTSCGGTPANCDLTLNNFASTGSQDAAVGSGWTANNRRWGAGAVMTSSVATADTLSVTNPASNALDPNSSDMTIEAWVKTSDITAELLSNNSANGTSCTSNGYYLGIDASGFPIFYLDTNGATAGCDAQISTPTTKINDGNWHLLAVSVTRGTSAVMYLDGINIGSDASVTSYASITVGGNVLLGSTNNFDGNLDSTRVYSRALSQAEILSNYQAGNIELQTRVGSSTDANDGTWEAWKPTTGETAIASMDSDFANWTPDYGTSYTKTLIHADGTDTSTIFPDSSVSPHSFSASGNAQVDIDQSKFGGASALFDGNEDYVYTSTSTDFGFGTGDFTIDFWIKSTQTTAYATLISKNNSASGTAGEGEWVLLTNSTAPGDIAFWSYDYNVFASAMLVTTGGLSNTGNWVHIALVRSVNDWTIYVDGVSKATRNSATTLVTGTRALYIGDDQYYHATRAYNGSIDELRISKGVARWTTGFTPPTSAYTPLTDAFENLIWWTNKSNESNTKMEGSGSLKQIIGQPQVDANTVGLWHLNETGGSGAYLKDSSVFANNGTPTSTTVVEGFSGKARLFDDVDDYVVVTDSDSLDLATNGTLEAWIKTNANEANNWFIGKNGNYQFGVNATGALLFTGASAQDNGGTSVLAGTWHYVAVTNNNTTVTYYVDGASAGTDAVGWGTTLTNQLRIGREGGSTNYFDGLIDEVRISNVVRTAEEVAESYRAGQDHYINKTISSTDLSGKTSLPFYVASDRQGTFLNATIGESSFANYQSDANTVGFWHLNEQSGSGAYIKDSSSTGNNGSVGGGAPTFTQGKIGKARRFNGSTDFISIPTSTNLDITSNLTLDAWIYPTVSGNSTYRTILAKRPASGNANYEIYLNNAASANQGEFRFWNGTEYTSSFIPPVNQWTHVAVTVSGGTNLTFYVNGAAVKNLAISGLVATTGSLGIGRAGDFTGAEYFQGSIDEVRISNTARTVDELRQAYEVGTRTHNITIDFKAVLNSGNLIANTSDLSFTIDSTAYGANAMGSNLFLGDKIIVKENYDGTEYIAQGTVNAVNLSTGAVTVAAWDTGSTVPSGGFTVNTTVFKWQREFFDLRGSRCTASTDANCDRYAVTNLTLRMTDGSQGATVYLDDIKSSGGYLNTPAGSTIISSTGNRYFQFRSIQPSYDPAVSASLTSVTLDYVQNTPPATPSLDLPIDTATNQSLLPVLKTTTTDTDSDYLRYKIILCENSGMSVNCQTFDQTSSQTGWSGQNADGGLAYTSGAQGVYTVQSALAVGTTYFWKSYAIDPGGVNTWSGTQATPYSFTTSAAPIAPTSLLTQGVTNPTNVTTLTPYFSAIHNDPDGDSANYYEIQVNTASNFLGTSMWDSNQTSMTTTANGVRSPNITYAGTTLSFNGATYYWRIRFWDTFGIQGVWSSAAQFTLNTLPATPSLDLPIDTATNQSLLPVLKTTTTDTDSDYLRYKILLCKDSGMSVDCQTFDQTSSQDGWSGQDADGGLAYASGTQGVYTVQASLAGTTYFWKSYAKDPGGSNLWSNTQTTPYSFTTNVKPNTPTLNSPANGATNQLLLPVLKTTTTDTDSDYLRYKILLCKDSGMSVDCQTFDQTSSQDGWSGQDADGGLAYASGTQGVYTVQVALSVATTYYWKSYAKDPGGNNTWSSTQGTPRSFTTSAVPLAPTSLLVDRQSNPAEIPYPNPTFTAVCNDPNTGDYLNKYQVQVSTDGTFSTTPNWDSGASGTVMNNCLAGGRSPAITYGGSALALNKTIYFWRIKFWDVAGNEGPFSGGTDYFEMRDTIAPTNCNIAEMLNNTSITLTWTDNSSDETQFRIEKNVNGGGFSFLTNATAGSVSYLDTPITTGSYQYRIRAEGPHESGYCTTYTLDLQSGNFDFKGIDLKGLNLR